MAIAHLIPETVRELLDSAHGPCAERIRWRGHRFEIVDVVALTPEHWQVILRFADTNRLPLSVPADDLLDAIPDTAL